MPAADRAVRDMSRVRNNHNYCVQIRKSLAEIADDRERFMNSHTYQNAVAMCILQIGEMAKQLSADFRTANAAIPWNVIARTRDSYAHHYGAGDFEMVWETAVNDIPEIERFCEEILKDDTNRI